MKKYKWRLILSSILSLTLLTSCVVTRSAIDQIEKSEQRRWVANETLTDKIIAVAKNKKPIIGYEKGLILIGQKHYYLIQSESESIDLLQLLNSIDLNYVSISPYSPVSETHRDHFNVLMKSEKEYQVGIKLYFIKPLNLLEHNDEKKIEKAGLHCNSYEDKLHCSEHILMKLSVLPNELNTDKTLPHKFREPITLKFYSFDENRGNVFRGLMYMTLPVTMTLDLLTIGIQPMPQK